MGVTETSIALLAGGFCVAPRARHTPQMRGYPVRHGLSTSLRAQRGNPRLRTPRYGLLRFARNDEGTSYPRRRVSSTLRPIVSITAASGILDRPPSRTMTGECVSAFSRRIAPEVCMNFCPSPDNEGAGNAGCLLHPRSRVQRAEGKRTRAYRYSRSTPAFPAQWFDGLCRALPGDEFVLPPSLPA
jgi:hypothetical protein